MKQLLPNFNRKLLVALILMLGVISSGFAQTITISTSNCSATANEFQFDVTVTNTGTSDIHFNSTVVRLTHSAAILAGGTNTIVFSYVGNSDFPNVWPPNSAPTFNYNPVSHLFGVSTSTGVYLNASCTAPLIAPGETKVLGRFSIKNTAQNFVPGAAVGLAWNNTTIMNGYINCAMGTTVFNTASGNRTLTAPCSLTIPAACTSPTINTNPSDQITCTNGTTSYTASFTGGTPVPTLVWQVQTGGVGLFTDLTEAAPYSNTTTNTLTISNPNIALSTNRYRLRANNTCGDVFSNSALLTVNPSGNAGTVAGTLSLCAGSLTTFSSNGDAAGVWSSTVPAVASVNASTGIVKALSAGSTDITYTVTAAGCSPVSSFKTLTVTGTGSLAAVAGGSQVCITAPVQSAATQPSGTSFTDGSCNMIATLLPSGLVPVSGNINACVRVEDVVHTYHNLPYVQRVYDIMPATNGANATATITLYYTQAEFDAYNLARGIYPPLPNGNGDVTGIANILITQFHGTGTYPGNYNGGTVDLINPVDSKVVFTGAPLNRWEITFDVNGFSGFYLHTSLTNTPLPISLVSFSGHNNGGNNLLEWTTSSEQNSSYFELQRSIDGINFVKATNVPAAGNSSTPKNYNYADNISGINANVFYYRLMQVDISGQVKYSTIVKIKLTIKGFNVEASPNPFADQLRVQIDATQKENAVITLNSLDGKKILQQNTTLNKGSNAVLLNSLDNLASGVYLLTVVTDTQKTTVKVIKQQ